MAAIVTFMAAVILADCVICPAVNLTKLAPTDYSTPNWFSVALPIMCQFLNETDSYSISFISGNTAHKNKETYTIQDRQVLTDEQ